MNATATREALRAAADLAALDDAEFGRRLLAGTPTNEHRDADLLRRWATEAEAFGAQLAAARSGPRREPGAGSTVTELTGGLDPDVLLLARYRSRPAPVIELYTDAVERAEELTGLLGWREWFPAGSVRRVALAHEDAHRLLHEGTAKRELRRRLGHTVLRLGRHRWYGHVAGADELAAHGYARAVCGLGRSPLLLTAALARAARPGRES
ncbi:hypothetical protein [Streptomyces sp. RFCAC02]|uniref:hypothetical protein n=1 Tax=Streptomyces sp. RFCAC02 TaxID=2499143 RepID=UPI001020370C|nr:hypothetical protein [Streptomyces sp. RFCAC02]